MQIAFDLVWMLASREHFAVKNDTVQFVAEQRELPGVLPEKHNKNRMARANSAATRFIY